jgi:YD repeat-containing protein
VYPGGDTVTYTSYNNAAQITSRTDGRGITATFGYSTTDGLLESVTFGTPNNGHNVSYTYDVYGRLQTRSDSSGSQQYTYGDLNEVSQGTTMYVGLSAKTVDYTYFPDGSRKTMNTPAGDFTYNYDGAGRMIGLTNPFGETTNWTYYANNWMHTQTLANGQTAANDYNAVGQLISLTNSLNSSVIASYGAITYDGASNCLGVTTTNHASPLLNGSTTYGYDTKDQLTSEASTKIGGYSKGYGYDTSGNITSYAGHGRSYNTKNQSGGSGFAYDTNGNPTTYNGAAITWDVFDNPTQFGNLMTAGYTSEGYRAWKQNTATGERTYFLMMVWFLSARWTAQVGLKRLTLSAQAG